MGRNSLRAMVEVRTSGPNAPVANQRLPLTGHPIEPAQEVNLTLFVCKSS